MPHLLPAPSGRPATVATRPFLLRVYAAATLAATVACSVSSTWGSRACTVVVVAAASIEAFVPTIAPPYPTFSTTTMTKIPTTTVTITKTRKTRPRFYSGGGVSDADANVGVHATQRRQQRRRRPSSRLGKKRGATHWMGETGSALFFSLSSLSLPLSPRPTPSPPSSSDRWRDDAAASMQRNGDGCHGDAGAAEARSGEGDDELGRLEGESLKGRLLPSDTALPRTEQVQQQLPPPPPPPPPPPSTVMDAAASYVSRTIASSSLLGTKSLGVDYGLIRTGIAVTVGYDPRPLTILSGLNDTDLVAEIVKRADNEAASRIVVGLPLHKNGTESDRSELTRTFATKLVCAAKGQFGPDFVVHLWDERYTSKEAAARVMASLSDSRRGGARDAKVMNLAGTLDADAACLILEHYYSDAARGKEIVQVPEEMKAAVDAAWDARKEELDRELRDRDRRRNEGLDARRLAMENAARMEQMMVERGDLGMRSCGKKKKKKKKRK